MTRVFIPVQNFNTFDEVVLDSFNIPTPMSSDDIETNWSDYFNS